MRTTLTLEDDVAELLRRLLKARKRSLKSIINEALRAGLREAGFPRKARKAVRTKAVDLGPPLIGSLDNVAEALAAAEGERFR